LANSSESDLPKEGPKSLAASESRAGELAAGIKTIRRYLHTLSRSPGVYRMLDKDGQVLYVGKAKHLRNRVASYTRSRALSTRLARMVARTTSMVFITTHTEAEALLLEANLIKKLQPYYNVFLRDDRSFPYIRLSAHERPRIAKHRGAKDKSSTYFGPFASAAAVNRTLNTLQRVFLLRICSDSFLESRKRPCLLYQIKRCSAPCVEKISQNDYDALVRDAKAFLSGKDTDIQKRLAGEMQMASDRLDYETAGSIRDRLKALTRVQSHQSITTRSVGEADVFAITRQAGQISLQVFFFRVGQNWGNRSYFPRHSKDDELEDVLGAFIAQFYDNRLPPKLILLNLTPRPVELLEEALTIKASRKVKITRPQRGEKRRLVRAAERNAEEALQRRLAENASQSRLLRQLSEVLDLEAAPQRIEVFDNSHISGAEAVGAMIVSGPDGLRKKAYRKFNIKSKDLSAGDDYGMMREVMRRRYSRLMREDPDQSRGHWPDLVLIDGGRGQLNAVIEALDELGIGSLNVMAISKGRQRNAGQEKFHRPGQGSFTLPDGHPALYFLQRLRDEAHRFAIGSHRVRRSRKLVVSPLDRIPGVGPKRKRALLHHFGSAKAVGRAGRMDIEKVEGISKKTARLIYDFFNDQG
jgi:excinuclease ABC subunit C